MESRRHGLRVEWLAAVAIVESDFNRNARGKAGEHGLWQVMVTEHGIANAWDWMRNQPKGFPLAMRWGAIPWRKLGKRRVKVLRSIPEGAYIAAYAIKAHAELCRRLGHRVGPSRCKSAFINRCPKRHRFAVDRLGHWQSGVSWPKRGYLRRLRYWSKKIKAKLEGRP